jgi:glutamate dehydrogenase/leucine dehydrogenase
MEFPFLDALAGGGFEQVVALHDRRSGLRALLAVHDTSAGPAFGGVRRRAYRDESEALRDVLRLARAMTHKCVLLDLPAGGAKAVVIDAPGLDLAAAYRHLGEVVEGLAGRHFTGPDVGTGERELGWMAETTRYVTRPDEAGPGLLSESTAEGVFAGIAASLRHLDGEEDWARRSVVVQGLGAVGSRLARRLREVGARVTGVDADPAVAEAAARELEIEVVEPGAEFERPCDVFAPCALGGILHDVSVPRLACRVVAGAANNVLAGQEHADAMHARGILHAPDFVVNSGALLRGAIFHLEGRREPLERIGARIGEALAALLEVARESDRPPARVAVEEAEARLARRREPR